MDLTNHFTLEEMLASQYASRNSIKEQFAPPIQVIDNLKELCENILQPLRGQVGAIHVSSGYRCEAVNKSIGGKPNSQHLTGMAADIQYPSLSNAYIFHKIIEMNLPFDQLIWEFGNEESPAWVHVSYNPNKAPRKQVLHIK